MAMLFARRGRAKSPCGCTQMFPEAEKDRSILVSDFLCRAFGKAGANVAPARPADVAGAPRSWGKIQGVCCPQRLERSPAGRAVSWQAFFWGDMRGRRGQNGHGTACRCRPHGANRGREREREREKRERERESACPARHYAQALSAASPLLDLFVNLRWRPRRDGTVVMVRRSSRSQRSSSGTRGSASQRLRVCGVAHRHPW